LGNQRNIQGELYNRLHTQATRGLHFSSLLPWLPHLERDHILNAGGEHCGGAGDVITEPGLTQLLQGLSGVQAHLQMLVTNTTAKVPPDF
jgi:hypothetical protein